VEAVPLQAWSGPEGSRKLMFPDFMTTAQGGGKVVSLMHWPHLPPGNSPGTHFCLRLSRPQGHSLKWKNNPINTKDSLHDHMTYNQNSMFVSPVMENKVKYMINRLKGSLSAGIDDVPEVTVYRCVQFIIILLVYIFNLSF